MDLATVFIVGSAGGWYLNRSRLINRRQHDATEGTGLEFKSGLDFGYQFQNQVPLYQESYLGAFNEDVSKDTLDKFTQNLDYLRSEEFRTPHHTLDPYKKDRGLGVKGQRREWFIPSAQ